LNFDVVVKVVNGIPIFRCGYASIPTKNTLLTKERHEIQLDPALLSTVNQAKLCVINDLWTKGYCITDGSKFGGDYLAYPGDPGLHHAKYIVQVRFAKEKFSAALLSVYCRMSSSVNKTFLMAFVESSYPSKVTYIEQTWVGVT